MVLKEFRITHSTLIEQYQFIESHLESIYAAISDSPFSIGLKEIERDSLGGPAKGSDIQALFEDMKTAEHWREQLFHKKIKLLEQRQKNDVPICALRDGLLSGNNPAIKTQLCWVLHTTCLATVIQSENL